MWSPVICLVITVTYASSLEGNEFSQGDSRSSLENNERKFDNKKWLNGEIIYAYDDKIDKRTIHAVDAAILEFSKYTCITFRKRLANDKNYVLIRNNNGCYSNIGMIGGEQELSLGLGCYDSPIIAMRQIMHTLGFHNEETRSDRDKYISIKWENVDPGAMANFQKDQSSNLIGPYDVLSIMHASSHAFSKDPNLPTIVPNLPLRDLAQFNKKRGFTICDVAKINTLYCSRKQLNNELTMARCKSDNQVLIAGPLVEKEQ